MWMNQFALTLSFFILVKFFPCPMFYWFQNAIQSPPNLLIIFYSFSCFTLLDFYYLATSWLGQSVFCSIGNKDKSVFIIVINIFLVLLSQCIIFQNKNTIWFHFRLQSKSLYSYLSHFCVMVKQEAAILVVYTFETKIYFKHRW